MQSPKAGELTMSDIARMAGVSESTVSRALSGSPLVADKTRKRIMELASAASYTVNEGARNLRLKQTRTVEVVIPIEPDNPQHISDPFFLDLLGSIADALTDRGYDMLLSKSPPWSSDGRGNPLLTGRADGIIIIGQGRRRRELRELADRHRAVVVWGAKIDGDDYAVVGTDNRLGGRLATAHLLRLGRKRIVFFGDATLPEIRPRYQGYCDALAAGGGGLAPIKVQIPFDAPTAFEAARAFVRGGARFDAVFAASDIIAMSAINALTAEGLRVPQDVAVVGYDDVFAAAWFNPALTTVSQSIHKGGEALVMLLLERIDGGESSTMVMEPSLVVRASCGGASGA